MNYLPYTIRRNIEKAKRFIRYRIGIYFVGKEKREEYRSVWKTMRMLNRIHRKHHKA